jgi:hypothetical protein
MKNIISFFSSISILLVAVTSSVSAQTEKTLYENLGMRLVKYTDAMTDQQSCALFIDQGEIYFALYGHDNYMLWSNDDTNLTFSPDSNHMIRIDDQPPYSLRTLVRRNGLEPMNTHEAAAVIRALVNRDRIRIRYYDWPSYDRQDHEVSPSPVSYVYNMGVKHCGWQDLGVSEDLRNAELRVYRGEDGFVSVQVIGNDNLSLTKGFEQSGGGCHITLGRVWGLFGRQADQWTSEQVDPLNRNRLIISNANGDTMYEDYAGPRSYSRNRRNGNPWPNAEDAAHAAWEAAPDGSIKLLRIIIDGLPT